MNKLENNKQNQAKSNLLSRLGFKNVKKKQKNADIFQEELVMSPARMAMRNFRSNKLAMASIITFILIFLACMILPFFYPVDVLASESTMTNMPPSFNLLSVPSALKKNPKAISSGSLYGAGLDEKGKIYLWGNLSKHLKAIPKGMEKVKFKTLAAGMNHVLALRENGELVTWGNKDFGLDNIPTELATENIKKVYANFQYSGALTERGKFYFWGNDYTASINPRLIKEPIKEVALNSATGLALTESKKLLPMTKGHFPVTDIPEHIQGHVELVSMSVDSVVAVTDDGKIHTWGNVQPDRYVKIPENIEGRIKKVVAGERHFVALLDDGTLTGWGDNSLNQLDLPSGKFKDVEAGYWGTYAIREDGSVKSFGRDGFYFGTDAQGRDVFRRLLIGGRMTMTVGAISVIISAIIGILVGGISGFYSGSIDVILMRLTEIVSSIPFLPLAMILSGVIGNRISENQRIILIMVILGILSWPGLARLVRAQILSERKQEFVTAAKALGVKESKIIFKHILPNVITVILVSLTLSFASSMLIESSLSFLGFGVQEPNPTWGNMLNGSQSSQVIGTFWWRWIFPSIALSLCTISINSFGDGLRDAIDPKSNER